MLPTHQRLLREAIAEAIIATDPQSWNLPEHVWHRTRSINDVKGTCRTFLVRTLPGEPVGDEGMSGDGFEDECELQIWAGYANLGDDEDGPTIDEDGRQLYCVLVDLRDPVTNGMLPVVWVGWNYEDDTPGAAYGYHRYKLRYLVADVANP